MRRRLEPPVLLVGSMRISCGLRTALAVMQRHLEALPFAFVPKNIGKKLL